MENLFKQLEENIISAKETEVLNMWRKGCPRGFPPGKYWIKA